jgi:ATP-dependent Clp protease ATP-binding subunit ClpB
MTSNLGSDRIQELQGQGYDVMKQAVMDVVGQHFRPEFINRVDEIVVFHPLAREQIHAIAAIQIEGLRKRLSDRDMTLEITDKALDLLGNVGLDPVFCARPLKRAIQQKLENGLAQRILAGEFGPGGTIRVDAAEGELVFSG